jgi:hypothetical protein
MADAADAALALVTLAAETMFSDPGDLAPPLDPWLGSQGWTLCGHITAVDAILRDDAPAWVADAERVYFGCLIERQGSYVVAIRGTERAEEWVEDIEGQMTQHPVAGRVHAGFWDLYRSMQLRTPTGAEAPLIAGLRAAVPAGAPLTFTGHSLGAPLATYGAAEMGPPAVGRFYASPRPGNGDFSAYAGQRVPDHIVYVNPDDIVTRVPFGFGYTQLPVVASLRSAGLIRPNPLCLHHAASYSDLLDHGTAAAFLAQAKAEAAEYLACFLRVAG